MARIRTIKPEFWADEKLAPLDPIHRLVFLGLISQADDAGRLVDNVRLIDGLLFPETDHSSRESLEVLATLGRITRYASASGQRLIQITKWEQHQRVDNPSRYTLPPPAEQPVETQQVTVSSREPSENLARVSGGSSVPTNDQRPTTNDRLPTTDDQRPAIAERKKKEQPVAKATGKNSPSALEYDGRPVARSLVERAKGFESKTDFVRETEWAPHQSRMDAWALAHGGKDV